MIGIYLVRKIKVSLLFQLEPGVPRSGSPKYECMSSARGWAGQPSRIRRLVYKEKKIANIEKRDASRRRSSGTARYRNRTRNDSGKTRALERERGDKHERVVVDARTKFVRVGF
jgi:hypothetical protein